MKAIVCEMCGSQDIVKQDGMYICQSCGTKYDIEEAKRLLIEVTVNNSEKIRKLYLAARQARDSNDSKTAEEYYGLILQEEPSSWEAAFYKTYYRAMQTNILNIASAGNLVRNCLPTVFNLMDQSLSDMSSKKIATAEVCLRVTVLCNILESSARNTFKSSYDSSGTATSLHMSCIKSYAERAESVYNLLLALGNTVEIYYPQESEMQELAVKAWKDGLQYWANIYFIYDEYEKNKQIIDDRYGAKVRKYEPSYTIPAPNTDGFPFYFLAAGSKRLKQIRKSYNANSTEGCYIATAVYGSYDCPQVWTLRRYRDEKLAASWYGRVFIHTYYAVSPTLVRLFGETTWFNKIWRPRLDGIVAKLNANGVKDTPYQDKTW